MATLFQGFAFSNISQTRMNLSWQTEEVQFFVCKNLLELYPFNTFIDIGANIGTYSILAAQNEKINIIYAFEPNPAGVSEIKNNCSRYNKIVINDTALSNTTGTAEFLDFGKISGKNCIMETSIHKSAGSTRIKVNTNTLDKLIFLKGMFIYMKIDVEGHEYFVLEGSKELLLNNKVMIQIELGHSHDPRPAELLDQYKFLNVFKIGPDYYFTNFILNKSEQLEIFKRSINDIVEYRWK